MNTTPRVNPNFLAEALLNQAEVQLKTRNHAHAARLVDQALTVEPRNLRALSLGAAIIATNGGEKEVALRLINQALKLGPDSPVVLVNAAHVFSRYGQGDRWRRVCERFLQLQPNSVDTLWNLANYYQVKEDDPETAEVYYRKVMELAPHLPGLRSNLGNAAKNTGRIEEAMELYREEVRLFPQVTVHFSNYLQSLHYDPAGSPEQIHAEHAAWGRSLEAAIPADPHHRNDRSPDRRLRIGYVSADFRGHPVGHNLLPLFRHHDHAQFEIHCYSDTRSGDEMTTRLRQHADAWRDTVGLPDAELAARIAQDQIDVLVDLATHSAGTRLGMFVRKPAPLQVTWMAYPGSSGLTRMDYRFTDPVLDPPGATDHFYTEQSIRLETFWCFEPPADSPAVRPLPAEKNGYVTFGCLNNFAKVNDALLELWREILEAVPDSRMVLRLPKGKITARVREKLGVDPARITGLPAESRLKYLSYYHRIDLALDPFPYTGHTTTLDGLWMGVPVVTLAGPTIASRGSLSILSNLGLTELAVKSKSDYVALAVALAQDPSRLRELRAGLRGRLERSVLMDANRFARQAEAAYRSIWHKWCQTRPA